MAYMSTDHVKQIRNNLKAKFPNIKFSVSNSDHLGVDVHIMASPENFNDVLADSTGFIRGHVQLNHYWIDDHYPEHAELFKDILKVINEGNWDKSDLQSDYHDVGFYVHFAIGKWDKPYVRTEGKK